MFKKLKQKFKQIKNSTKGFSLVELIVVIAIMAVMAAVLVPALLSYTEKSRAQKDSSALDEMTNAITLAVADMDVYDELLQCAEKDNYSCYCDGSDTNTDANKTVTKAPDYWLYNDNCRLLDETVYKPAGKMRGVTITFKSNNEKTYILANGIINKIGNDTTKKGSSAGKTLGEAEFETLYNRLRSTIGDTLTVSSQTYRYSDYTIFISMGTTGGNQATAQDAIKVYGQYNGTNLSAVSTGVAGGSQEVGNISNDDDADNSNNGNIQTQPLSKLTPKTWTGLNRFNGHYIWTDGINIYYSLNDGHYVLQGDEWVAKTWTGLSSFSGSNIWTDGTNTYYSAGTEHYVLNGDTWETKTWIGLGYRNFYGDRVWTDDINIYYSANNPQYVLQDGKWVTKTWTGLTSFDGVKIWTDGTNYYYSKGSDQYVLQDGKWVTKTWTGLTSFDGNYIWTDGTNYYCSSGNTHYVLQNGEWEPKTWTGLSSFYGSYIWTDGSNIYCSNKSEQYVFE